MNLRQTQRLAMQNKNSLEDRDGFVVVFDDSVVVLLQLQNVPLHDLVRLLDPRYLAVHRADLLPASPQQVFQHVGLAQPAEIVRLFELLHALYRLARVEEAAGLTPRLGFGEIMFLHKN